MRRLQAYRSGAKNSLFLSLTCLVESGTIKLFGIGGSYLNLLIKLPPAE